MTSSASTRQPRASRSASVSGRRARGVDRPAARREPRRRGVPDPGRAAGDQDGARGHARGAYPAGPAQDRPGERGRASASSASRRDRVGQVVPARRRGRALLRGRRRRRRRAVRDLHLRQRDQRVRGGVGVEVQRPVGEVEEVVAAEVVARVVLLTRGAAEDRGLLRRLELLGPGEEAAGRDARGDERAVVRAPVEVRRQVRDPLAGEVVEEDLLDRRPRTAAPPGRRRPPGSAASPTGRRRRRS